MHLLSSEAEAKLRANRLAWTHFEKFKDTYVAYAKAMKDFVASRKELARVERPESRVYMVTALIIQADPNIWGLANANLNGEQVAECFARMVVDHES
jgi:hypothetical protein